MTFADQLAQHAAEYAVPKLAPVGSIVEYHGSIEAAHGAYEIIEPPTQWHRATPGSFALRPLDPDHDFGPGSILYNVRPASFTVVVLPAPSTVDETDEQVVARWTAARRADLADHPRWPRDSFDDDADVALARAWAETHPA